MKQAATRELYAYWNGLRGERLSPERGEIDPLAIRGILADTFILEVDESRTYRFRLCGTRFNALFMEDLKGSSFSELWAERDRVSIGKVLASVCDDAAPVVAGVSAAPPHRTPMDLELLLLPVRHLGRTHARILGCLSPARLTSWIGLLPVQHLSLQGMRILPEAWSEDNPGSLVAGADGETSDMDLEKRGPSRRGHLFVLQ